MIKAPRTPNAARRTVNDKGRVFLDFIIEASQRVAAGAML